MKYVLDFFIHLRQYTEGWAAGAEGAMLLSGIVVSSKVPKLAKIYFKSVQNFGLKFREILTSIQKF